MSNLKDKAKKLSKEFWDSCCIVILILLIMLLVQIVPKDKEEAVAMVMGGELLEPDIPTELEEEYAQYVIEEGKAIISSSISKNSSSKDKDISLKEATKEASTDREEDIQRFFRPSNRKVLNTRVIYDYIDESYDMKETDGQLPSGINDTLEDTIINYYSVLREAANPVKDKSAGCGTIGEAMTPYPLSYQFLSREYQQRLSYEDYLKTFDNILHINLISYKLVPVYEKHDSVTRYFVELEIIQGTEQNLGSFIYYYGYVDLIKENGKYKINNIEYVGENYLCAPYHGWYWEAKANAQIRYGGWCKLIKGEVEFKQDDNIIKILFQGTDGYEYCIVYFRLTNGTDTEIAQYRRENGGEYELIHLVPEDCIDQSNS